MRRPVNPRLPDLVTPARRWLRAWRAHRRLRPSVRHAREQATAVRHGQAALVRELGEEE